MGWWTTSLVGLHLAYLAPKSPRTLHLSEECLGQWIKTGFRFAQRGIYISFYVLARNITHYRVSMWRDSFSSIWPIVTSMVGIFPSSFLRGGFYYTFINRFSNIHSLKHVNFFFKWNRLTVKSLHTFLLTPVIRRTIQQNFVHAVMPIWSENVAPRNEAKYLFKSVKLFP